MVALSGHIRRWPTASPLREIMANVNLLHRFSPLQDETVQLNLDDLRGRLAQRLALLALAVAQFFVLFYESSDAFPLPAIGFWLLLTAVSLGALSLSSGKPRVARHLLVWGLTAVLLYAMFLLADPLAAVCWHPAHFLPGDAGAGQ